VDQGCRIEAGLTEEVGGDRMVGDRMVGGSSIRPLAAARADASQLI